jgi:hypothetical protein
VQSLHTKPNDRVTRPLRRRWRDAVRFENLRDFEHSRLVGRRCVVDALHDRPRRAELLSPAAPLLQQ